MRELPVRVGIQQRILPAYRVTFFDALASICGCGLCVFAGKASPEEGVLEGNLTARLHASRAERADSGRSSSPDDADQYP